MEVICATGVARSAHDVGHLARRQGLPGAAGVDLQDGWRHHRRTGQAPRCASSAHEFKARTTYGDIKGATLLDWPLTLKELEPYYTRAEDKMGVTRTHGIPGLPGNNNFKVMYAGATKLGYKECNTGHMAINSRPRDGPRQLPADRLLLPGLQVRRQVVDAVRRGSEGRSDRQARSAPESHVVRIEHNDAGKVTSVVYHDSDGKQQRQKARVVCVAGNSIETPRLLLLSTSSKYPGWAGQLLGPGRQELHASHDRVGVRGVQREVNMYRGTTMAGHHPG